MSRERLLKGAGVLGGWWRAVSERCSGGWSPGCPDQNEKKFCVAKRQWILLALESGREVHDEEYGLALSMTAPEWDKTGLTMKFEADGTVYRIGAAGTATMTNLRGLLGISEVVPSMLKVMANFPGSRIEKIAVSQSDTALL